MNLQLITLKALLITQKIISSGATITISNLIENLI